MSNPDPTAQTTRTHKALNRLTKWRVLFAGWQVGTRLDTDPEAAAIRDHRELSLLLRVELSALLAVLLAKGVLSTPEFLAALERAATEMNIDLESRFPGVTAEDDGLHIVPEMAVQWMQQWKP